MEISTSKRVLSPPLRFMLGMLLILVVSMGVFYALMSPPMIEMGLMMGFLSITAAISGIAGYVSYRLGWMERSPAIRWALLGGYILSSILTFFNVWITARLMFASQHDLLLATVLLLFAGGIAVSLGYFLSSGLTDRICRLDKAAQAISHGDLDVRVPVTGKDELSVLAVSFNEMAAKLKSAASKQEELDQLRRDLIAWVGHDLQTPLASMRLIVEALADGVVEDPDTIQRYLRTAQRDIQALSSLIDDLFQMAQLDAGGLQLDREYNSLSDLISDTLESFSHVATQKGVILEGSIEPGLDPIYMDAQRIGRVLNNLISNALRHTQSGEQVRVKARPAPQGVLIEVTDTGEGIPPEDLPMIFDRFYRGERSRNRSTGGTGLGLAIAKGIVEAHGGTIHVESNPQFTSFTFTLPARDKNSINPGKAEN